MFMLQRKVSILESDVRVICIHILFDVTSVDFYCCKWYFFQYCDGPSDKKFQIEHLGARSAVLGVALSASWNISRASTGGYSRFSFPPPWIMNPICLVCIESCAPSSCIFSCVTKYYAKCVDLSYTQFVVFLWTKICASTRREKTLLIVHKNIYPQYSGI